jgi:DNA-directed RNA polymerase specialized sigma24 family protein
LVGEAGCRWLQVHQRLTTSLAGWRGVHEAEDVASEVVLRGLRHVDIVSESWPRVWVWAKTVAQNVVRDRLRAESRRPRSLLADLDGMASRELTGVAPSPSAQRLLGLVGEASGLRRRVLQELLTSIETNDVLARRLGVTVRAVEKARQWIREQLAGIRSPRREEAADA